MELSCGISQEALGVNDRDLLRAIVLVLVELVLVCCGNRELQIPEPRSSEQPNTRNELVHHCTEHRRIASLTIDAPSTRLLHKEETQVRNVFTS
jgi:hypothetical protein